MAKIKTINRENTYLRLPTEYYEFTETNKELLSECIDELSKKLKNFRKPQGISANQIGYKLRVCLVRVSGKWQVMINPEILWSALNKNSNEGCLSICGRYIVSRPSLGIVQWQDMTGKLHKRLCGRRVMRRVAHEIDHLNGKTIIDVGRFWADSNMISKLKK